MPTVFSVQSTSQTFVHFCGQLFLRADDKELALACVRAYNDWHIDGWAGLGHEFHVLHARLVGRDVFEQAARGVDEHGIDLGLGYTGFEERWDYVAADVEVVPVRHG